MKCSPECFDKILSILEARTPPEEAYILGAKFEYAQSDWLHAAAESENTPMLAYLPDRFGQNLSRTEQYSLLFWAAYETEETFDYVQQRFQLPYGAKVRDSLGRYLISNIALGGNLELMKRVYDEEFLTTQAAPKDLREDLLWCAIQSGSVPMVRFLLQKGIRRRHKEGTQTSHTPIF
ncbi:MAG: hypothetical protein Q4D38_02770 [Planctomycetia bacterium]|nr:hypothetical protein [Planctomycetia bacterium]